MIPSAPAAYAKLNWLTTERVSPNLRKKKGLFKANFVKRLGGCQTRHRFYLRGGRQNTGPSGPNPRSAQKGGEGSPAT